MYMGVISRGYRNAFRNGVRSVSVILILSIAIGLSLVMLISLNTVTSKISSVKSSIGNTLSVSPAGIRGFEGGGELLTDENIDKISKVDGVSKVIKTLNDHLSRGTSLASAVEAGSFGQRQQRAGSSTMSSENHNFQMPLMITATNDLSVTTNLNVSKFDVTSGEKFDGNSEENIAMLGKSLAEKNNLSVGQTFKAYDKDIKLVGIFDAGNNFANNLVVMPIKSLQSLSDQSGQVNSVLVQVDSVDKLDSVSSKIKEIMSDKADIVSSQDSAKEAVAPLENIKTISTYSLVGSLIAGAIILFLTMVMIVRERRREIGVLKAIGSSNYLVTAQFAIESLVLTLTSSAIGIIAGVLLSNPILKVLVNNNVSSGPRNPGEGHMMMMRVGAGVISGAQNGLRNISANVGFDVILYGLLAALMIAILGSVIPSFIIAKISPAEVMRAE